MPTISVIVPVYKVEKSIHRCVDSILGQTFRDFELILVDDGSPDNCGAICDEYAAKDSRVVVIHQENGGLSAARNAGIDWAFANSDSQWLTFIDSDDWVHMEYLQRLFDAAREYCVKVSACKLLHTTEFSITQDRLIEKKISVMKPEDFFCLDDIEVPRISACVKIYSKELFKDIRYPIGLLNEDLYITHRILFQCKSIAFDDNALYYYYARDNSIMHTEWTPKRLDEMIGYRQILCFFKEEGYLRAWKQALRLYFRRTLYQSTDLIKQKNNQYDKYLRKFRWRLKYMLIRYRKILNLPFKDNKWIYEVAYPFLMNGYWFLTAQWNKVKRLFGLR